MRRQFILVLFVFLMTVTLISLQDSASEKRLSAALLPAPTAILQTADGATHTLALEPVEEPKGPSATDAVPATDSCTQAPTLKVQDGGSTINIREFNSIVDGSDPELSCMWGQPVSIRGFRTAWYKMVPDDYGLVSLSTRTSNYDTVLAVHKGACEGLVELTCNDDDDYFSSRVELYVQAGETYYVEVADWNFGATGQMTLNIQSELKPINSQWETVSTSSESIASRSRHAVVVSGTQLYVIAGQTTIGNDSDRTPTMYVYNTATGTTQQLANMTAVDGFGYSNTTAALVNGRIYMPSGYIGSDGNYDGTHWVYDIAGKGWSKDTVADNSWAGAEPAIYSQATPYNLAGPGPGYFLTGGLTGVFPANDNSVGWVPRPEVYFYSVNLNTWYSYDAMSFGRFGHVAARQIIDSDESLCVAGGMTGIPGTNREVLESTSCYDFAAGAWTEVAPLNQERYFASSAVDANGNWYVFGGYDAQGNLVAVTERYDALNDEWRVLAPAYSVVPTRAWSRGAFVGNDLWIVGGETINEGILNMIQHVSLFRGTLFNYLPLIYDNGNESQKNNTLASATSVAFPSSVSDRFYTPTDGVNIYGFNVPAPRQPVMIWLNQNNSNVQFDLAVYTENKVLLTFSRQPGNVKSLTLDLNPGRYYVAVERASPQVGLEPPTNKYTLNIGPG